ncbi:hypothetical protein AsAng_0051840 [Aureispira anguillae]|uniref:Uncharacterized protein n=1 Tax=Aureispira anguillae TaxID=2864201 RepID=A0A915YJZ7_9BACT|nr:hypothetical protein AsAng_0051840 [Aureispira anguillae]
MIFLGSNLRYLVYFLAKKMLLWQELALLFAQKSGTSY